MSAKEKKKRKLWDADQMVRAYNAVKNKEMGYLKASQVFNVPKSTLERYCKNQTQTVAQLNSMKMGRKPTFSPEMEQELVAYSLTMVSRFYGLRSSDIRALAFQLAIKNGLPHQFNAERKIAGRKWMKKFLNRNPCLSFRTPQATSANRAKGFSKEKVDQFNDILEAELPKINFDPTKIYNVDETGVTVVQHKMEKVLSLKGQKQVGGISSAERGALITLVTCMSASGFFVPPLFIFPRVNMKEELKNGAPPGSQFACHKSGWIQTHIFTQWIVHFINTIHPSKESPVILILDGHFTHTRNIDVIDKCRDNGVILICLPPHSSHRMQPLDVSFMSPFKTYYAKEIDTWLKNHPGRVVTAFQVAELVGKAYMRAATLEVAINGFRKSGIFPFDRNHFRDHDFAVQNDKDVENNRDGIEPAHLPLPDASDVQNDEDDDMSVDEESAPAPVISPMISATDFTMLLGSKSAEPAHFPLPSVLTDTQTTPPSNFDAVQNDEDDDLSVDKESFPATVISPIVPATESAMLLTTTIVEPAHLPLPPVLAGKQTTPSTDSDAEISPLLVPSPSSSAPSSLVSLVLSALQSGLLWYSSTESTPLPVVPHTEKTTPPSISYVTRLSISKFSIKPAEISPLPKFQSKGKKQDQVTQLRGGKPLLVTSSPYKHELQEQLIKKLATPGTSKSKKTKMMPDKKKTTKNIQKTRTIKNNETSLKEKNINVKKKIPVKENEEKKLPVKKNILAKANKEKKLPVKKNIPGKENGEMKPVKNKTPAKKNEHKIPVKNKKIVKENEKKK